MSRRSRSRTPAIVRLFGAALKVWWDATGAPLLERPTVTEGIQVLVSFIGTTSLFALLCGVLPDVQPGWHDVTTGAFVTAVLFTIGQQLIGLHLGQSSQRANP